MQWFVYDPEIMILHYIFTVWQQLFGGQIRLNPLRLYLTSPSSFSSVTEAALLGLRGDDVSNGKYFF